MSKKSQTKQTNPRRIKGRIYRLPEANNGPQALPPEVLDAAIVTKANVNQIPTESICDKARRLANEAEEAKKKERAERELAFMKRMFETDDLAGAGIKMTLKTDYPYKDHIVYTICGRQWIYSSSHNGHLMNIDEYMSMPLSESPWAFNLEQFGKILQEIDARERDLHTHYPNTWWGRFKAWWHMLNFF